MKWYDIMALIVWIIIFLFLLFCSMFFFGLLAILPIWLFTFVFGGIL
ncbi:hypothetical protein [Faecalitalea cylindroides]